MLTRIKHLTNLVRFNRGAEVPIIGPLKAEWEVINTCNAKCLTCLFWKNKPDSNILSTPEAKNLIKQLAESGVLRFCFSGGEPLLRKDLVELINFATGQRLSTALITNGLLITEHRARELVDAGLGTVFISLEAASPKLNDEIRGLPGYYDLAMSAMDNLKAMRRNANPKIYIKTTLTKKNVNQLIPLANLTLSKGIDGLSFQLAQLIKNTEFVFDENLLLDKDDYADLVDSLDKMIKEYGSILTGFTEYYHALKNFFKTPDSFKNYRSVSGYSYAVIDSWGNIFTNPNKMEKLGNIREDSFAKIWFGQKANQLRENTTENLASNYLFDSIGNMSVFLSDLNFKRFFKILRPIFNGAECF